MCRKGNDGDNEGDGKVSTILLKITAWEIIAVLIIGTGCLHWGVWVPHSLDILIYINDEI